MNAVDIALWVAALVLAGGTLWWSRPSPLGLDWERLFKLALLTQIRGQVQAREGDAQDWLALGRERVWFDAAAREPFAKLISPDSSRLQIPEVTGERVLTERLAKVTSPAARLAELYSGEGDAGLYEDPETLGEAFSLSRYLGAGLDWDALAEWTPELKKALERKGRGAIWLCLDRDDLFEQLDAILPRVGSLAIPSEPEALAQGIDAQGPEKSDRFVLVAGGPGAVSLLSALSAFDGLRDRVLAVVLIQPELEAEQEWLEQHFTHLGMDTELNRVTGWFQLRFLDPQATDAQIQRVSHGIAQPELPKTDRAAIEVVELGLLPGEARSYPKPLLARALAITVLAWLGSRG